MAITFLKVKVINPEHPKKMKECEFLVDSGAVYSVVPKNVLKNLGIKSTSSEEFNKTCQNTPQLCWGDEWPTLSPGGEG